MTGEELVEAARAWLGVPWRHQGRSRYGCDCAGLVVGLLAELSMLPEDFRDARRYGRTPDGRLVELVHRHGRRAPAAVPGAIALFRWPPRETPGHMGIVSRGGYLIHADARLGRVVEVGLRGQWARTLDSLWYVPGVEYGAAGEAAA